MTHKLFLPALLACILCINAQADLNTNNPETANASSTAMATQGPLATAEALEQAMSAEIKKQHVTEKTDPKIMQAIVEKVISPHTDVQTMARSALGRDAWMKASPQDQQAFVRAFTDLMIKTYATGMGSYTGQTFSPIRAMQPNQTRVEINSKIFTSKNPNTPVSVLYRVIYDEKSKQWKLYDFSVEGISMINSFRSQFQSKIANGISLNALTEEIKNHNE